MKKIVIGVVAHVDAGKTTLSESMLYKTHVIRNVGRVDNGDTYLDSNQQERQRGITIFLAEAKFQYHDTEFIWVDTPGHIDFSTEMERTLQVLDYAIVVINGLDGVQSHTMTIWKLLEHYQVPTFIFINKMDISHLTTDQLMNNMKEKISDNCIDFTNQDEIYELMALCSETLLNEYVENQSINQSLIIDEILQRHLFPCFFGSALKMNGIEELLNGLSKYTQSKEYSSDFGARVYKITHDEQGNRLTHLKMTGGTLRVKEKISQDEKIDQIRIYSGSKYKMVEIVEAGDVCAMKGLQSFQIGDGLGFEKNQAPVLSSYMSYKVTLPEGCDCFLMLANLKQLAQEDPQLHVTYHEQLSEIRIQLMGEIQIEVLKTVIQERFGVEVFFDQGNIVYKETIVKSEEGIGHYEPLRHYAEVHLLLEPGPRDSGLQFFSDCPLDMLDGHWQRLILSHLAEKEHLGVLTGSPITDMKITLLAGKSHLKHTEGGDFRQATYRAIRQGLKATQSVLLEPYYDFELEIPQECLSKAIYDIEAMDGSFVLPDNINRTVMIKGSAPVAKMQNYQREVIAYTKGQGQLICSLKGYKPCLHQEEIIKELNYDSETDLDNPTGSIFCSHGAGFYVKWDKVPDYMHIPMQMKERKVIPVIEKYTSSTKGDEELEEIFVKTYGPIKQTLTHQTALKKETQENLYVTSKQECLLVDGYNVIYSWDELKELANENLDVARTRLIDILSNYQGYKQCLLILVFDAYKVKQNLGSIEQYHNIHVVYTKEAQTADMYIERVTHELSKEYNVVVATSDALEQLIVMSQGGRRMSSRELKLEVETLTKERFSEFKRKQTKNHHFLLDDVKNYKE